MKKLTSLSIFFPAYNEELNIAQTIHEAHIAAQQIADSYEIIIVDDASKDQTSKIVEDLQALYGNILKLISHETNKGYGGALITGFQNAQHEYVFFSDADLQFDLRELALLIPYTDTHDVVIGYRHNRQDPKMRLFYAKGWNIMNRILFGLRVTDIDCAFKLFKRDVMKNISITSQGNMISAEILIDITQRGIPIKEIPVTHLPRIQGVAKGVSIPIVIRAFKEIYTLFIGDLGKQVRTQFISFVMIGIFNTLVDIGAYVLLTRINPFFARNYILVKAGTYLLGTFSGFLLNTFVTFKQKRVGGGELFRFYTVMVTSLLVNISITYILTSIFGVYDIVSVLIATALCFVFTFIFMKTWVFITHKTT